VAPAPLKLMLMEPLVVKLLPVNVTVSFGVFAHQLPEGATPVMPRVLTVKMGALVAKPSVPSMAWIAPEPPEVAGTLTMSVLVPSPPTFVSAVHGDVLHQLIVVVGPKCPLTVSDMGLAPVPPKPLVAPRLEIASGGMRNPAYGGGGPAEHPLGQSSTWV